MHKLEQGGILISSYREIVTKAVVSKGKKLFTSTNNVMVNNPSTILGCWVINHNFNGVKENNKIIEIPCTYSNNMNLSLGEVEFKISTNNSRKLEVLPDSKKLISIIVKNLDGSISTLFECKYTFDWHN